MSYNQEMVNEMWYIYALEYYSAVKKKKSKIKFAGRWMELVEITLSEVAQIQKDKY